MNTTASAVAATVIVDVVIDFAAAVVVQSINSRNSLLTYSE